LALESLATIIKVVCTNTGTDPGGFIPSRREIALDKYGPLVSYALYNICELVHNRRRIYSGTQEFIKD